MSDGCSKLSNLIFTGLVSKYFCVVKGHTSCVLHRSHVESADYLSKFTRGRKLSRILKKDRDSQNNLRKKIKLPRSFEICTRKCFAYAIIKIPCNR